MLQQKMVQRQHNLLAIPDNDWLWDQPTTCCPCAATTNGVHGPGNRQIHKLSVRLPF